MPAVEPKQLPKEVLLQTNMWRIAAAVICTLVLTAILNVAAGRYLDRYSPNIGYLLIKAKWHMLRELPVPVDLLILGDSSGNQGVDPDVIKERLGMSSVNLCTIGDAMLLNDLRMLELYLNRHGPPEAVVIVHGYDIWSRDFNISVLAQIPGSWWEKPPELDLGIKQRIKVFLNRQIPVYTQSTSLAQVLESPWTAFRRDLNLDRNGFMKESNADPKRVLEDTQVHLDFVRGRRPVISDLNRRALERICALADEHQFDVFIANGPLFGGLYADVVFQQYFVRIQSAIANMAGKFDHVYYILNPPAIFSADAMQSADHVSYTGAVHYSARIAREILSLRDRPENPADLSE